jgi:protein tyrosine/serine phosphatase
MADDRTTDQRERRLAWEGCLNARDVGGYATADGGVTRWGAVIRSDSPSLLTPAGHEALEAYGIRTAIDLRFPTELAASPNPFADPAHPIDYVHISLIDPDAQAVPGETQAQEYCRWLDRFAPTIGRIITTVARAEAGGVLIHCLGGRDRTGVTAALLLSLAGVPPDTIANDYALSSEYLRPRDEEWLANGPGTREQREAALARGVTRADVMHEMLDHLDAQHGGAEAYLLAAGVAPEDLARIRARLRAPHEEEIRKARDGRGEYPSVDRAEGLTPS